MAQPGESLEIRPVESPREQIQRRWFELVQQWRDSGLKQADFCRDRGISVSTFSHWKHRLLKQERIAGVASESSMEWLEVRGLAVGLGGAEGFEVVLRCGRRVCLSPRFDAEGLRRLVGVLEGLSC